MPRRNSAAASPNVSPSPSSSSSGFGLASLRRELHLHNLLRRAGHATHVAQADSAAAGTSCPPPQPVIPSRLFSNHPSDGHLAPIGGIGHARRESFLYRPSDDPREPNARPVSRASSIASNDHGYALSRIIVVHHFAFHMNWLFNHCQCLKPGPCVWKRRRMARRGRVRVRVRRHIAHHDVSRK